ncbi:MAG: Gfo/Idh/MocA family oxidoreductase [Cyclobacteriaceae bacterium]|nr:Gfo/Idh/MocA family oxidoreductase [Cyclobacteriaceae bacterium]
MSNRRDFLKNTGKAGLILTGAGLTQACGRQDSGAKVQSQLAHIWEEATRPFNSNFNMSGYAAEPIPNVRVGFVGLGNRGPGAVYRMAKIEGVSIAALCDLRQERVDVVMDRLQKEGPHQPVIYAGDDEIWKKMCERDDIDLIYITTPWFLHAPMALYAMEQGKHVCTEVPAATSMEDCRALVETSERTKKHCMMLENCCYDFFELLTLNMARQGYFGEIVHGEGAYIHDILEGNFSKTKYWNFWRLRENADRNGSLYPTHGLGPVCQVMNINRGDALDYLVSMSSNDFSMGTLAVKKASEDGVFEEFMNKPFRGNMNSTLIKTKKGRSILLQHDVSSPRPYSRIHMVSGTEGFAQKYPFPSGIFKDHTFFREGDEGYASLVEKYQAPIVKKIGEMARQVGGHGGMDFIMEWRMVDCLRNGLPLDMDVYDAALWSAIGPLSEWSVANRSATIDIPDYTGGHWQKNTPVDVDLKQGANTKILL